MKKINYVIPTWSGYRVIPNKKYLQDHLLKLLSLKNNLSQITIIKPIFKGFDEEYYNINYLINKFKCKVEILEKYDNLGQSYGQLFFAYEKFRNEFDYYIFVEDDYMPNIENFDSLLLNELLSKNDCNYLCSFMGEYDKYPKLNPGIGLGGCAISNGIVSSKDLNVIYNKISEPIKYIDHKHGWMCQVKFTDLLKNCGLNFCDFSDKFRVPYGDKIIEYGRTDTSESIFIPHQLYDLDIKFREMQISDLDNFLKIRNECKEFLHDDRVFNIEEAKNWYKNSNPKFFMIELNNKDIGYFRTSNWVDDSVYIGCDIDSSFRGLGLGFLSYIKFIHKLSSQYNISKFKLEVLSSNTRAYNLYTKLGFKVVGVSENKIIRNNIEIESIIMELNYF